MRASDAIPLNHSRQGDPEYCCSGGKHNYHFRPGASKAAGHLIWCCCKSVLSEIEPEAPMTDDDLTAELAKAKRIADGLQFACRDPDRKPIFTACGGPAAEAYWAYFHPARIAALLGALERHMNWFTAQKDVRVCGGCLLDKPCPDELAITGKGESDDA